MGSKVCKIGLVFTTLAVVGCTSIGDSTKVGAATGGAMGAGLGALIGSQTGDAAGGLAVGAIAGAGSGAAIGNALQAQQEAIQTQDEAIERQQQIIRSQAAEIEELRRLTQDSVQYQPASSNRYSQGSGAANRLPAAHGIVPAIVEKPLVERFAEKSSADNPGLLSLRSPVGETRIVASVPEQRPVVGTEGSVVSSVASGEPRAAIRWQAQPSFQGGGSQRDGVEERIQKVPSTSIKTLPKECRDAGEEIQKAGQVREVADKLFHNRRALRLCPQDPALHHSLAGVYLELGRLEDAKFEFQEALRLDPSYEPSKAALKNLKSPATVLY
jgi:tetratricopeptide (TPR) repeat protein